jgi:6-phosphogluconolactonase
MRAFEFCMATGAAVVMLVLAMGCVAQPKSSSSMVSFAYGVSPKQKQIFVARFDVSTQSLETIQKLPLGFPADAVTYSPKHNVVYAVSYADVKDGKPNGAIFSVGPDGRLGKKTPFAFAHGYSYLSFDRTGEYLLGSSYMNGSVDVYRLDASGMPTQTDTRSQKRDKAHAIRTTPDNRFAYVPYVKDQNALYQYAFDSKSGKLTPLKPAMAEVSKPAGPRHMVFHPTMPYIYFSNEQQLGVSVYQIGSDGRLTLRQICQANKTKMEKGLDASGIVISPDGRFVFVAVRGFGRPHNVLVGYAVGAAGTLQVVSETPADAIPWAVNLSSDGKYILVGAWKAGTLTAYRITASGSLEKGPSIPWLGGIQAMVVR